MIGTLLIMITYQITVYAFVMRQRTRVFNKQFMSQFKETHTKELKEDNPPDWGYPDTGNGWYSK